MLALALWPRLHCSSLVCGSCSSWQKGGSSTRTWVPQRLRPLFYTRSSLISTCRSLTLHRRLRRWARPLHQTKTSSSPSLPPIPFPHSRFLLRPTTSRSAAGTTMWAFSFYLTIHGADVLLPNHCHCRSVYMKSVQMVRHRARQCMHTRGLCWAYAGIRCVWVLYDTISRCFVFPSCPILIRHPRMVRSCCQEAQTTLAACSTSPLANLSKWPNTKGR